MSNYHRAYLDLTPQEQAEEQARARAGEPKVIVHFIQVALSNADLEKVRKIAEDLPVEALEGVEEAVAVIREEAPETPHQSTLYFRSLALVLEVLETQGEEGHLRAINTHIHINQEHPEAAHRKG